MKHVFILKFVQEHLPLLAFICLAGIAAADDKAYQFTALDIEYLQQFSLANLPPPPPSSSNQYANDKLAAQFGQQLFFDRRLSANGKIACATCHQPQLYFSDGLAQARGLQLVERNTPSLLGAAYGPWKYWDGRKDSLWAQALEPLEDPREQGLHRKEIAKRVLEYHPVQYQAIFGAITKPLTLDSTTLDTMTSIFVNSGKALMAYQRRLHLPPAPIDKFIQALVDSQPENKLKQIMSADQVQGLRLFVGKAACVSCHNGPLFTNFEFHNVGVPEAKPDAVDLGRYAGIERLRNDEFTCLSQWSDAEPEQCLEMQYLKQQGPELVGAFKTPSLRNVAMTAPYMHSGQFETLETVVNHYNKPTPPEFIRDQHPSRPHFDILPLGLNEEEVKQLTAFLRALTSPLPEDDPWWREP